MIGRLELVTKADQQPKIVLLRDRAIGQRRWILCAVPDERNINVEVARNVARQRRQQVMLVRARLFIHKRRREGNQVIHPRR